MKPTCLRHWAATWAILFCIGAAGAPAMRAGVITIGTTPFTGIETDFEAVGDQTLPYTDAFGRVVSGGSNIFDGSGLFTFTYQTVTFSNLAAGVRRRSSNAPRPEDGDAN